MPTCFKLVFSVRPMIVCALLTLAAARAMSQPTADDPAADSTQSADPIQEAVVGSESATRRYPSILLADTEAVPTVEISWISEGERRVYTAERAYSDPSGGDQIAPNLLCYVALGGTRIETGAGHPQGIIVRIGLTKIDNAKPMFEDIDPGTEITMSVSGMRLNQPVKSHDDTGLMHMKYALGDLEACSLPGTARNQFLMSDPEDTLGGRVSEGVNATPGGLDGKEGHGEIHVQINGAEENTADLFVRVPYALLRHLQDPWKSDLPGTFFEPIHLHAEAELIVKAAEPYDREPMPPMKNPLDPMD